MNPQNLSAINLLSHQLAHHPHLFAEKIPNPSYVMKEEARREQMTIFYNGQVIVFDDVSAEKAKDVMSFLTNLGTSKTSAASNGPPLFPFPGKIIPTTTIAAPQVPSTPVIYVLSRRRRRIASIKFNMNHQNLTALNLLSHQLAHHPHLFPQNIPNPTTYVMKEARGEQMTIFYNGQVIVFDDVPAEKANEVMSFVTNLGTSKTSAASNGPALFPFPMTIIPNNTTIAAPQLPPTPVVYDLPMTRKASLYRFLEKRKDRIAARGPYQANNAIAVLDKPIEESMSWLALAPQSPQVKTESSSSSVLF